MNLDNFITKHIVETTGQSGIDWIKTMYIQNTKKDTDVLEISNRSWEIFHAWRILRAMKKVLMVCDRSQKEKTERHYIKLCGDTGNKVQVVQDLGLLCHAFFLVICAENNYLRTIITVKESSERGSRNSST